MFLTENHKESPQKSYICKDNLCTFFNNLMNIFFESNNHTIIDNMEQEYDIPEDITHYSAVNDRPEILIGFVDKFVKIQLVKNRSYSGFVHSIDPVSHSIILSVPHGDTFKTTLFPGFAITDIEETEPDNDIKPPPRKKPSEDIPLEEIIKIKKKVIGWFHQNLLPVTEAGNNIVIGSASILPPYTVKDICTDSPVISLQLKNLLANMPEDFEPK